MNRRLKRALIRENTKSQQKKRKLNWDKVKSFIRLMVLLWLGGSLFICFILLLRVVSRNTTRDNVLKNPIETNAVIVRKKSAIGNIGYLSEFKFYVSGEEYVGTTFKSYEEHTGQKICVKYLSGKPEHNICCNDLPYESIKEDVIFPSFKASLWIIVGIIIYNYKNLFKAFNYL